MTYPEHDKLAKVSDQSQTIGQFLDWLMDETGIVLARWHEPDYFLADDQLIPAREGIEELLAEYFNIDRNKLEEEKRAMLEEMRVAEGQS